MKKGAFVYFDYLGNGYRLMLVSLVNVLIGNDYAIFFLVQENFQS